MVNKTVHSEVDCSTPVGERQRWFENLARGQSEADRQRIAAATDFVCRTHGGVRRLSGEALAEHLFSVGEILAGIGVDAAALVAALLHEAPGAAIPRQDLLDGFGDEVVRLIDEIGRVTGLAAKRPVGIGLEHALQTAQAEELRSLLLAMVADPRVVLIKLADCLDNVRRLRNFPPERANEIATDSRDIYAPLANRLGIWQIKWELEDLVFRHLEPEAYRKLARYLDERRSDRETYIADVMALLRGELAKAGIEAEVNGRPKHLFSIWRKMQRKGLGFHELFDIRAVRILVKDVPQCYGALGVVHSLWHHIPKEFDDYIANPKENGYQSLHTAVMGPGGRTLEVQIRSHDMHRRSELGVASHWRYKEGARFDPVIEQRIAQLRQLVEGKEADDAGELLERFNPDIDRHRVYVFTPKGKIMDLPLGATALDFAYAIHTEVGHRCRGAKVDGRIVPLTEPLNNGCTVEVLLGQEPIPNRNWLSPHLGYLATSRARNKVRHWFNQRDHDANLAAGKAAFERELHRLGVEEPNRERLLDRFHVRSFDELLAALGRGVISTGQIATALGDQVFPAAEPVLPALKSSTADKSRAGAVQVAGVGNLLVQMANCCKPVPPEPIVGFITRGRGVTVHRKDCQNLLNLSDEERVRLVDVQWSGQPDVSYTVDIQLVAYDRQGLLRDITALLSQERVNVLGINSRTDRSAHQAYVDISLEVGDAGRLSCLLERLGQLPNVVEARRRRAG